MASNKLVLHESAIIELENACFYYNNKISGLGFEFEEEIFTLLEFIRKNPLLFPIKFAHIHEAVAKRFPFVITYEVKGNLIIVLAIFHTKQDPGKKTKHKLK